MLGSMIRHKVRLRRFVHQEYFPTGSTMAAFPLFAFWRGKPARKYLADRLREIRHSKTFLELLR